MSDKVKIQSVIDTLNSGKGNLCCKDVIKLLRSLDFEVRDGKKGGHKIYTHNGLTEFYSASFNCGHGKNPEIKPAYIGKIVRIIETYQDSLIQYLSNGNGES
jgi:hypothetical protein